MQTRWGTEYLVAEGGNGFRFQLVFIGVDQKIGFQEYLVVQAVDAVVGVVVGDEEADPVDELFVSTEFFQDGPGRGGTFDFLVFARRGTVFFFGCVDADVVEDGGCPQDVLLVCRQSFQASNGVGVSIDLEKVVDAPGIAVIKGDGFLYYLSIDVMGIPAFPFHYTTGAGG